MDFSCMICGSARPNEKISVNTRDGHINDVSVHQNIRYCNDNTDCKEKTQTYDHMKGCGWKPKEA